MSRALIFQEHNVPDITPAHPPLRTSVRVCVDFATRFDFARVNATDGDGAKMTDRRKR